MLIWFGRGVSYLFIPFAVLFILSSLLCPLSPPPPPPSFRALFSRIMLYLSEHHHRSSLTLLLSSHLISSSSHLILFSPFFMLSFSFTLHSNGAGLVDVHDTS